MCVVLNTSATGAGNENLPSHIRVFLHTDRRLDAVPRFSIHVIPVTYSLYVYVDSHKAVSVVCIQRYELKEIQDVGYDLSGHLDDA